MRKFFIESLVPTLIGISLGLAVVGGTTSFFSSLGPSRPMPSGAAVNELQSRVGKLESEIERLRSTVAALSQPQPEGGLSASLASLKHDVDDLALRVADVDKALLDNPTKAVSLLLLKKDIDGLSTAAKAAEERSRSDIDRIYDLNKWLLGSMAIAIVALALKVFYPPTSIT